MPALLKFASMAASSACVTSEVVCGNLQLQQSGSARPRVSPSTKTIILVALFSAIAVARIAATYRANAEAFDEHGHIAAGMEFLDKHSYVLEPLHPPLSRVAIVLPLYIAGERYPTGATAASNDYNVVGSAILQDSGHYVRNLMLARIGVLPFLVFATVIVFVWTRREFGDLAAMMAVALFTTLPSVLAFSSIAYSDMVAAATQLAALFAFSVWLRERTFASTALLAVAAGLAVLSKATTLIFVPAAALAIVAMKWVLAGNAHGSAASARMWKQAAVFVLIACAVIWAGYGFAVGHIREGMGLSLQTMPSFHNLPAPLRGVARHLIIADPRIPAPALIKGLSTAWVLNHDAPPSYLLGHIKTGGWWYFFLVGIAVKSPLPFLLLLLVGAGWLRSQWRGKCWTALAPAAGAMAILVVSMAVKYNAGVRHILVVFPLLAIVAGCGCAYLWNLQGKWRVWTRGMLIGLLAWQAVSTAGAQRDFIAYFNELGGKDPSRVLVAGCDLDCGQDVFRLSAALRERHVSHLNLAIWSSADMSKMDLPEFDVPAPYTPVGGWFAISLRALRFGDLFHQTYPPDAFAWLSRYQPVEKVGSTILLYHIPENDQSMRPSGGSR